MPRRCRAGRWTSARTGNQYTGLGPPGCKIQVDQHNQPLHTVQTGGGAHGGVGIQPHQTPYANIPNISQAAQVGVAKQRVAQNPTQGTGCRADENRVVRRMRLYYHRPGTPAAEVYMKEVACATLDTGAMSCILASFDDFSTLFPPAGAHANKWERLRHELPYGARRSTSQGVTGSADTVIIPPTPHLTVMVQIYVGRKGQQQPEWRGGQCQITFQAPGGKSNLVGIPFLRAHGIYVK